MLLFKVPKWLQRISKQQPRVLRELNPIGMTTRSFSNLQYVVLQNHRLSDTQWTAINAWSASHFHMENLGLQKNIQKVRLFSTPSQSSGNEQSLILGQAQDERRKKLKMIPFYKKTKNWFLFFLGITVVLIYTTEKKTKYKWLMKFLVPSIKMKKKLFEDNTIPHWSDLISAKIAVTLLTFLLSWDPQARTVLVDQGGIQKILDWVQNTKDEDSMWYAMNCFCLVADDARSRQIICTTEGIIPFIMKLTESANMEIAQLSMQLLYFCMAEKSFKDNFLKNQGLTFLMNWARSPVPEMSHFALNLLAIFFISHTEELRSMKSKLTDEEKHLVFSALNYLGETYNHAGEHKLALEAHKQCLLIATRGTAYNAQVLTSIAVQLKKLGREEEANKYFAESLESNPYQIETAYNLASDMCKLSKDKKTLEKVVDILDLGLDELKETKFPGAPHPHPLAAKAYALIVKTYERLGKLDNALDKAEDWALECDSDPNAHFNVGCLLTKLEFYDEALNSLGHAIRLRPDRVQAYKTKAQCFYKLGDIEQAINSYRDAVQCAKENSADDVLTFLYHEYGGLLYKFNRYKEALDIFTLQSELHNQSNFMKHYSNNSKIIKMNPDLKRGCCLEELGKKDKAYSAFTAALDHPTPAVRHIVAERCRRSPLDVKTDYFNERNALCSKFDEILKTI